MTAPLPPVLPGTLLGGSLRDMRNDALGLYDRARDAGDVVRVRLGVPPLGVRLVLVLHPEGALHVLGATAGYRKDTLAYREVEAAFGGGLLVSEGADWQRQRRLVAPLFTPHRVAAQQALVQEEADALVASWAGAAAAGSPVDLHAGAVRLALHVVGRAVLGADLGEPARVVLSDGFPALSHYVTERTRRALRTPTSWPVPAQRRARAVRRRLHGVVDDVLAEARRREGPAQDDLLTALLAARDPADGSGLDDAELRDQVLLFVLAGHETTAVAVTGALHLLGRHPRVQEQVREEVAAGPRPAAELPVTTRAVQEALRLLPPVPAVGRQPVEDDVVCGRRVPAGSVVLVPVRALHRDPRWWDEPERFDPDRFLPERSSGRPRGAYLPFAAGPRACLGAGFAMQEAVTAVAAVVRAYRLETDAGGLPLGADLTLRPTGPAPARLSPVSDA